MHYLQLMEIQVGTWLVGNTTSVGIGTDPKTQFTVWLIMYLVPAERSASIQSNLKWLLPVFTIKVNILYSVCTADVSLWLDHLNYNVVSRKQTSIHVYVAWNIKIDISKFPVSKVTRQKMEVEYGQMKKYIWLNIREIFEPFQGSSCQSPLYAIKNISWIDMIVSWKVSHQIHLGFFWLSTLILIPNKRHFRVDYSRFHSV